MLRKILLAGLALAAAACGKNGGDSATNAREGFAMADAPMAMAPPAPPPPMEAAMKSADGRGAVGGTVNFASNGPGDLERQIIQQEPGGGGGGPGAPLMSYTYAWSFAVPTGQMQSLLDTQRKACEDAGPAKCYVTNSYLNAIGKEGSNGQLSLRATEDWVRSFEAGVGNQLKPFGASVYSSNRTAEDLTTQIVDIEARLKSMLAYRDGLQAMLRDKPGKLADLLDIQRTLADAQGDIDSRQSMLAALKLRVSMSVLNLSYQPEYAAASESVWRPLGDAFGDFIPGFSRALADIVRFISGILPVVIFGSLSIWALIAGFRWFMGRGRRKAAKTQKLAVTPAKTGSAAGP